jgi:signal transduction histidine kinase
MLAEIDPSTRRRAVRVAALRALGLGTVLATLLAGIATLASSNPSAQTFALGACIGLTQVMVVGVTSAALFTAFDPRLKRMPRLRRWAIIVPTLLALSLLGALGAGAIVIAGGGSGGAGAFLIRWLPGAAITFVLALLIGMTGLSFDRLRDLLRATTATLHQAEIDRVRAQRLAFEARLASLESRVRPHFLFNSLNAALALIPDDAGAAERVIERLASLLHASLDADPKLLVPLGREMKLVADYLEIERVRFGERLRFSFDVPVELETTEVPLFAVQTLAENSVKHAVASSPDGGSVRVVARLRDGHVTIAVGDDGTGFPADAIAEGHGLHTLRERLAALFGDRATLTVGRDEGGRSQVTFEVPTPPEAR